MKKIFIKELSIMSKTEWKTIFSIKDDEFEEIFGYLSFQGIMKNSSGQYKFEFVGVIRYKEILICGYPKYYNNEISIDEFKKILKVLEIYNNTKDTTSIFYSEFENESFIEEDIEKNNKIWNIYMTLINDYLKNGLYVKEKSVFSCNSYNEIDWNRTIENGNEIIQNNIPIYYDCISESKKINEQNFIKKIHSAIIKDIAYKLKPLNELSIIYIPENLKSEKIDIESLGGLDYVIYAINNEITQQFFDQKIEILNLLRFYIESSCNVEIDDTLVIFGTKYFYVIWENVCKYIFNNMYDKIIKNKLPSPKWYSNKYNKSVYSGTLIPDIVYIDDNEQKMMILDAKYYNINFINNENIILEGNPGLGDVNKQFLYEKIIRSIMDISDYKLYNAFIMPTVEENELITNIGNVTFTELFENEKPINILKINANEAYKMYIYRQKIEMEKVEENIIKISD